MYKMPNIKHNKITPDFIAEISAIPTLEAKKRHMLDYIGEIEINAGNISNDKKFHLAKFRHFVETCKSEAKFTQMLWNSLLSGEGMARLK